MSRIPQDADVKSRTLISATFKNQDKQTTVKINPKMDKDESQDKSKLARDTQGPLPSFVESGVAPLLLWLGLSSERSGWPMVAPEVPFLV